MTIPHIVSLMAREMYTDVMTKEAEEKLRSFSDFVLRDSDAPPAAEEVEALLKDADGCLTGWGVILPESAVAGAGRLRIIGHTAGSVKTVVPALAYEKGITVVSAWKVMAKSVGEMALGMAIAGMRNFAAHDHAFKVSGTPGDPALRGPSTEGGLRHTMGLHHATVGVIGASATGRYFIRLLRAFGDEVSILICDPTLAPEEALEIGGRLVSLDELLSASDMVSLHAPSTEETRGMMGAGEFARMKDSALFINTARGALVDHDALYEELKTGRLKACLDVYLEVCPDPARSRFRELSNVLITPGIAGPTAQVLKAMGEAVVDDFARFFSGEKPRHLVDPERLSVSA